MTKVQCILIFKLRNNAMRKTWRRLRLRALLLDVAPRRRAEEPLVLARELGIQLGTYAAALEPLESPGARTASSRSPADANAH
ncbi:MAG: hypothetical protein NT075_27045 [Chloroflexi bacterium]|nr:hypothetical protein [Chloroflexota bacterium]